MLTGVLQLTGSTAYLIPGLCILNNIKLFIIHCEEEQQMCLICAELSSNKLTAFEARRNLNEMREVIAPEHRIQVLKAIWEKEDEEDYYNLYKN